MTSLSTIKSWFDAGKANPEVTHMVIKWDTFDGPEGDYPVYATKDQDVRKVASKNSDQTIEVYAMHIPWETQAKERRAFHWESA